ncbi:MAG TPA: hypothetical protein PK995_05950 [Bacteroidia bacterium]|nr:hypothetical protein [Bacteroidia bacterium]
MKSFSDICRNMNKAILYNLFIIFTLIIFSCTDSKNNADNVEKQVLSEEDLQKQVNVQNFINTIPSAMEVFQVIQQTKINYNPDYLNDVTKHKNYSLEKSMALNLGVYGADMAISSAFNQVQESMFFLKCTNYLARELGISSAFDEQTMDRLEKNKENRDSVLQIIMQSFKKADKIFSDNKRGELSVLMITGSFVESMSVAGEYILSNENDSTKFNTISPLYFKQKESLSYLINLLENSKDEEDKKLKEQLDFAYNYMKDFKNNVEDFKNIHKVFKELRQQIVNVY